MSEQFFCSRLLVSIGFIRKTNRGFLEILGGPVCFEPLIHYNIIDQCIYIYTHIFVELIWDDFRERNIQSSQRAATLQKEPQMSKWYIFPPCAKSSLMCAASRELVTTTLLNSCWCYFVHGNVSFYNTKKKGAWTCMSSKSEFVRFGIFHGMTS